jgi:hypothetical protein
MIGVKLEGRLGNQLFQYAFAFSFSKRNKQYFFIDQEKFEFSGRKYFRLPGFNKYKNRVLLEIFKFKYGSNVDSEDQNLGCILNLKTFKDKNVLINGYFQSFDYFIENKKEILNEFKIKSKFQKLFNKEYGSLFKQNKIIGVHIRKTDIVTLGILEGKPKDASMPLDYYLNTFNEINNFSEYKVVFATDDVQWARQHFAHLPNSIINENEEIIDFQILMNADVVITSNSTFSWWAAFLNPNENKKIFAPKLWFGTHKGYLYPKNIFSSLNWNLI